MEREGESADRPARTKDPVHCLVFDLGAGSGRTMLARCAHDRLSIEEIDRFEDLAVASDDGPRWDVAALKGHVENGLRLADRRVGEVDSIGIDSWGLDYALLGRDGLPVVQPYHYRNARSLRGFAACPLGKERLFAATGSQILPVNTVFQLYDETSRHPDRLRGEPALLMMADLISHHLTGERRSETTLARTSGLLDAEGQSWSEAILAATGIPKTLFQPLIRPGSIYGRLRPELADPLGWGRVPVVAVASHDTASAVAGLPLGAEDAFLVCGSWSLVGAESARPDTDAAVLDAGFGNEGGVEGRPFLVRSLNGLHLIRNLRRSWHRRTGDDVSFAEIGRRAAEIAASDIPAIDASDPVFFDPDDVVDAVNAFHVRGGRQPLSRIGAFALSIYKGLAHDIAGAFGFLEARRGRPFERVRVCGGGALDETFCGILAAALDRPLIVGPVEASAWGNAVMQLVGTGRVRSLRDGRRLVAASATFRDYRPGPHAAKKGTVGRCSR